MPDEGNGSRSDHTPVTPAEASPVVPAQVGQAEIQAPPVSAPEAAEVPAPQESSLASAPDQQAPQPTPTVLAVPPDTSPPAIPAEQTPATQSPPEAVPAQVPTPAEPQPTLPPVSTPPFQPEPISATPPTASVPSAQPQTEHTNKLARPEQNRGENVGMSSEAVAGTAAREAIPPVPPVALPKATLLERLRSALDLRKKKRLEKITAMAEKRKSITNDDVEKLLRVSHRAASRYLAELVRMGRLRMQGSPRDARYEIVR